MSIIDAIKIGCSCNEDEARNYLQGEVDNLQNLGEEGELSMQDFDDACFALGIDLDYVIDLIGMVSCNPLIA